jgi:NDP-sugar pyrophosphorylase family protein
MLNLDALADRGLGDVTAVILAGGLGTRLRPALADRPKVMAEVGGRPFLTYLLDQLTAVGVRYAVLCTGYLGEQIKATFGDSYRNLRLAYSQESSPLGTAGALRLALPLFKSASVLVMNGDSFCQTNLKTFWKWHQTRGAKASLLLTEVPDTQCYGRVQVDKDGLVLRFEEKGHHNGSGWVNAGIYLFDRSQMLTISAEGTLSLEREVFPTWIGRGLYGYQGEGRFLDIGTPEAYAAAERFFAEDIGRWPNDDLRCWIETAR